jgi:hypothetical protein
MQPTTIRISALGALLLALIFAPAAASSQTVPDSTTASRDSSRGRDSTATARDSSRAPDAAIVPTPDSARVPDTITVTRDSARVHDTTAAVNGSALAPRDTAAAPREMSSASPDTTSIAKTRSSFGRAPIAVDNGSFAQSAVRLISPYQLERARLGELTTGVSDLPMMLRSVSAMLNRLPISRRIGILYPEFQSVDNTSLPWSMNDGDLWAGRGFNSIIGAGLYAMLPHLEIVIAPQLSTEENKFFALHIREIERMPLALDRSQWAFPWYNNGPYSVDMPTRFGPNRLQRLSAGQSTIAVSAFNLQAGYSNENEWWGPGIGNALILSNNAPGFPHYFLRSAKPVSTRLGKIDFRWLVGGLTESAFFDTTSTNNVRSLSAFAATLQTGWDPNLTFGLARSVFRTADRWGQIPARWMDIFSNTGHPNNHPLSDSSLYPGGRDQVYSLFGRWVFPKSGFEFYGEWGRTEFPTSLRDFLVAPNHSQAYTVGLQWRRAGFSSDDFWRIQAENTSVEQSPTFRDRPLGVWYTSRVVVQGYTNRGQPLGAAVGPGSSGQNLNIDYMRSNWSIGFKTGRVRLNEDVRSISPIFEFKSWCTHDIDLYYGGRATAQSRLGFLALDLTAGNRLQPWFQARSGCPRGNAMVDIRNNTISVTFIPFLKP